MASDSAGERSAGRVVVDIERRPATSMVAEEGKSNSVASSWEEKWPSFSSRALARVRKTLVSLLACSWMEAEPHLLLVQLLARAGSHCFHILQADAGPPGGKAH